MTSDALPGADTKVQNSGPERTGPSELPSADALFGPLPKKELPSADALFGPLPNTKERYDEVQARYDAGKATDAEFDEARSAYTKEFGLGDRIGHTWNDAKIGSGTWEFIKSAAKGIDALTPWGAEKHADRATANEIADRQNELDAKLISQATKDAVEAGDVETLKALSEGRVKTPRAVSRGEEAVLKLKNLGKEGAAAVVGAVHGGGDVLMAVPAAISKGIEEVALAVGADDTAAALNRGRRDIVGARESGINTMVEATGGSQEAAAGGRLVGGVAVPVSVPGVQAAMKAAGTVAKPVGQAVQKAIDVVSPVTRKAFEATAALVGEASENLLSAGMDVAGAGAAKVAGTVVPYAGAPLGAAVLANRNSLLGVGKYLRAPKSRLTAGGIGPVTDMAGQAYSKIKDALVTPSQMVGEIATGAVGQSTGSLIGDSIASAAKSVEKMSSDLAELQKVRRAEILEGRTHATVTQSNIENLSARVKSVEMGQKFLLAFEKMGAAQKLEALHGQLGDAITYAIMGAGAGTAMASGMTENPIEAGFGPGAMLGAAVSLIGNGVRVKTLPDGSEEMVLDHDVVRNGAADLVEAAAKEAQEAPKARIQRDVIAEGIDAQGFFDEVQPDGSTVRYTRTDRGIEGKKIQQDQPEATVVPEVVATPDPRLKVVDVNNRSVGGRLKPGTWSNKAIVEATAARRGKLKPSD